MSIDDLDGVAYLRGYARSVDHGVHRNRRYLRPEDGRDHFLWSDVYPLVEAGIRRRTCPALRAGLLGLMDQEDLKPAHRLLPNLHAATRPADLDVARRGWRDYWSPTLTHYRSAHGGDPEWTIRPAKANGEMVWGLGHLQIVKAAFTPHLVPGALRLWFYPQTARLQSALVRRLRGEVLERSPRWRGVAARESPTQVLGVMVTIPYRSLLAGVRETHGIGIRVRDFSVDVLDAAFRIGDETARQGRAEA